jgi:hypothetical protein
MFFDQLNEKNAMVQSNHAFEELALAGLGTGSRRASTPKHCFIVQALNEIIHICFMIVLR